MYFENDDHKSDREKREFEDEQKGDKEKREIATHDWSVDDSTFFIFLLDVNDSEVWHRLGDWRAGAG